MSKRASTEFVKLLNLAGKGKSYNHQMFIHFFSHSADPVMSCSTSVKKARSESLWGLFTGDSLSMPVHWYYDPDDIKQDYGQWLKGFVAPKSKHPSSILTISAVGKIN